MTKHKNFPASLVFTGLLFLLLSSCNNVPRNIPFPVSDNGYAQPVTVPLRFSNEKKLNWDTVKTGGIKPVVQKLDIDALPSKPFDTAGFKPLVQPVQAAVFDFDKLQDIAFSMDTLPAFPLKLKTFALPAPLITKAAAPLPRQEITMSILEFNQLQGFSGKISPCIIKSRKGLIWIGNDAGLFCYDGEYMKLYLRSSDTNPITGLVEDNDERIWILQESGISVIDIANGTIGHSAELRTARGQKLTKVTKDDKGNILIGSEQKNGLVIIDPAAYTFKRMNTANGLPNELVWDIMQDRDKNIWISTRKGICIITATGNKLKYLAKANRPDLGQTATLAEDREGHIWIASLSNRADMLDIKKGTWVEYDMLPERGKGNFVITISQDTKDNIWLCTTGGIEIIDPAWRRIKHIDQKNGLVSTLAGTAVRDKNDRYWVGTDNGISIIENNAELTHIPSKKQQAGIFNISASYQDPDGKLWLGSFGAGIEIIDRQKNIRRTLDRTHGISNDFIQSFQRAGNSLWITSNGGLDIVDFANKSIRRIGKKEGLSNNIVYIVFRSGQGDIWLAGPNGGIDFIDSRNTILKHAGPKEGLSDSSIVDIKQDNAGLLWIATVSNGVDVIDPEKGVIKHVDSIPALSGSSNKLLLADAAGRIWIGTDKGLVIADTQKGTLTTLTTVQGLTHNHITSLSEYNGNVIAGTASKVNIITAPSNNTDTAGSKWGIHILKGSDKLVKIQNSWSTDLITKEGEFLWCDEDVTIINSIREETGSAATYVTGLSVMNQSHYFVNKSFLKEKDTLWSHDTFYTKSSDITPLEYAAYKQGLKWDSVSGPYNMPVNLRIPYNQNYLQFQYGQANLGRPDTIWYAYILEGIDKQWSAFTNKTVTENYLNLPPGDYTFKVKSKGPNGMWGKPAELSFTITPPWYKTWWAYALYALLAAALLRAYIAYRSRRLQKENKLLEEKVNLRTKQLQQSIEDLKATQTQLVQSEKMASLGELTAGIAHEIQNPLNFVNNFSEVNKELIEDLKQEIDKGNLEEVKSIAADIASNEEKINHHGKRADSIVKSMLQHSRSGSGQKELTDINALADEYLRLSYHGLRAKDKSFNATFTTNFDDSIEKIKILPQEIGRTLLNLYNNAFYAVSEKKKSFAANGYEPTVAVSTKKLNGKVEIKVTDNGHGIPQNIIDKIFQPFFTTKPSGKGTGLGLSLTYDIIKAHGGEIKVNSKENEGTEFIISMPV